jgi:signal transduction histidine kinase
MSGETVTSNWLEIANPNRIQQTRSESGRRRVLCAKGLGRFAVSRIASTMELNTRRVDNDEVQLSIDWNDFNNQELYLEDIEIGWQTREQPSTFSENGEATRIFTRALAEVDEESSLRTDARYQVTHGTVLRLSPPRLEWDDADIDALSRELSRLTPPPLPTDLHVSARPDFQILLDVERWGKPQAIAPSPSIQRPMYRLAGEIDEIGMANLSFRTELGTSEESVVFPIPSALISGPLSIDLRVWDLDAGSLKGLRNASGERTINEVRRTIRDSSGVAVYRDGFRVQPYGDPDFDWLGLDARRVNNPTMRLSNNQIVGFIFTTGDKNPELRDQANRQGLIENSASAALRELVLDLIRWIEERRYALRRSTETASDTRERVGGLFSAFNLDNLRGTISRIYPDDLRVKAAIDQAEADIEKGVEDVQEVVSRFSRLSTLGSLVDVMLHEGNTALSSANYLILLMEELVVKLTEEDPQNAETLRTLIDRMQYQLDALGRLFRNLEPLGGRRRGRPRKRQLHSLLQQAVDVVEGELETERVHVSISGPDRTVTVDPADILQIVVNLLRNAVYWTSQAQPPGNRYIAIITGGDNDEVVIDVSDNGPGIAHGREDLIFDAYYTTRDGGVGLGLNIAGSIASDFYDGTLSLVRGGPLEGATFRVTLRKRIG